MAWWKFKFPGVKIKSLSFGGDGPSLVNASVNILPVSVYFGRSSSSDTGSYRWFEKDKGPPSDYLVRNHHSFKVGMVIIIECRSNDKMPIEYRKRFEARIIDVEDTRTCGVTYETISYREGDVDVPCRIRLRLAWKDITIDQL